MVLVICQPGSNTRRSEAVTGASSPAGRCRAGPPPRDVSAQLSVMRREASREGLAVASDCDAVRRGQGEASPAGMCGLRWWRDWCQLAIALSVDPRAEPTASPAVGPDA